MLYAIIALFALATVFGLIILKNWLTGGETSRGTVYAHGIFAAIGLVVLLVHYSQSGVKSLQTSIILFVVAASVGFYIFFRDIKGKVSPVWLDIVHGFVNTTVLLFFGIFAYRGWQTYPETNMPQMATLTTKAVLVVI
jgi:hypothetical protein